MDIKTILFQVIALFIMMGVGLLARKRGYMSDEAKRGMTDILINIVTPAIVISSFSGEFEHDKVSNALIVLAGAVIMHVILCSLSFLLFKKEEKDRRAVLRFAFIFGNFGFIGFPVLQSLFGIDGVFYGAMFTAAFYMFSWTFGVSLFAKKTGIKDKLKSIFNIPFISVVVGFLMYISPFRLPDFLQSPINAIGAMNTPLSMLIIGSSFAEIRFKEIFTEGKIYIVAAMRLLAVPVCAACITALLNLSGIVSFHGIPYQVVIIEEAMPCAAYAAIFAAKFGSDVKFASKVVAIATAASVLTIPLAVTVVSLLGI